MRHLKYFRLHAAKRYNDVYRNEAASLEYVIEIINGKESRQTISGKQITLRYAIRKKYKCSYRGKVTIMRPSLHEVQLLQGPKEDEIRKKNVKTQRHSSITDIQTKQDYKDTVPYIVLTICLYASQYAGYRNSLKTKTKQVGKLAGSTWPLHYWLDPTTQTHSHRIPPRHILFMEFFFSWISGHIPHSYVSII